MNRMMKMVIVLILGLVLILVWSCSNTKEKSNGKIVVTYNNGPRENDPDSVKLTKQQIADFNKIYPNIEVKWTDNQFDPQVFVTQMAGGTAEDIIFMFINQGHGVIDKGYAMDLTDRLTTWNGFDEFNKDLLKPFTRNDHYFGIPVNGYLMGLWYNKRLFREANLQPPTTWDEFMKCAVRLTDRKKGIYGFGICAKGGTGAWQFLNWGWQAGGDFEKNKNGRWMATFDEPPIINALQFIKDLRWKYNVLQPNLLSDTQDLFPLFAQGKIAMMFGTNDWVSIVINTYKMNPDDLGTVLLPAGSAGHANQMGGGAVIINSTISKEKQDAAWKFLEFYVLSYDPKLQRRDYDALRRRHAIGGGISLPVFLGKRGQELANLEIEYKDVIINWPDVWKEASKYARPEPPYFTQQLYEILDPVIQGVLTNKNTNPQKILSEKNVEFQKRFLDTLNEPLKKN